MWIILEKGKISNILSSPSKGIIEYEYDLKDQLISEEIYKSLPSGYVIPENQEIRKRK
jgi:hypothetical protein